MRILSEAGIRVMGDKYELGFDAISSVPTGGHFFGSDHTMARYETAFYRPILSDWQNFESWEAAGAKDALSRATEIWQKPCATMSNRRWTRL